MAGRLEEGAGEGCLFVGVWDGVGVRVGTEEEEEEGKEGLM